jgi:adenylate cyclase
MERVGLLARWLAANADRRSVEELFPAFCEKLVRFGLPVWRASLGLEVLHPEVSGSLHVWTGEELSTRESARATAGTSPSYLNSPTRIVDETEQPFRRRLDAPCPDMPVLEDLRLLGATDYVMYPLPFLDRTRTAVIAFATRPPGGFTPVELDMLEFAANMVSSSIERHVLHRIAIDLLDTYVGPRTGRRIIEGRVDRGEADLIEAAIWFTDLRGFTHMSETVPIREVLTTLNAWFEIIGDVVEAHGGEVLKFIGDAVLAIFPTSAERSRTAACRDALAATQAFCSQVEAANEARAQGGGPPFAFGVALHIGEVAYGNIGARRRLDFTVIGPAVNRASRLQELAKNLGHQVVISRACAQEIDLPLVDIGRHSLRDIEKLQQVFTLP